MRRRKYPFGGANFCDTNLYQANRGLAFTVFLVFFLSLSVVVFTDSYEKNLEEQRKLSYGAWHIAIYDADFKTQQAISGNATVLSIGSMQLAGFATDVDGVAVGGVGTVDEALQSMGNLSLLEGRLPLHSGEIAVEASLLTRLGFSYELGQTISLSVAPPQETENAENANYTFTLCGVVKNYSAHWKTDGFPLVSYFVHPDFCVNAPQPLLSVFAQLRPEYAAQAESLRTLALPKGFFVKNDFAYLQYASDNAPQTNRILLQAIITLAGFIAMVLCMEKDIRRRQNSYVTMRILGATKQQIWRFFLREKPTVFLVSGAAGIVAGILIPYSLCLLLAFFIKQPVAFHVISGHVGQTILFSCFGLVAALLFCMMRLLQLPLRGKPQQQAALQAIPKRRKPLRKNNLFSVLESAHRGRRLLSILLIFLSSAFLLMSSYQAWADYCALRNYQRDYPSDYAYGMLLGIHRPNLTMSEAALRQITTAYGVKDVQAFSVSDYYPLTFASSYEVEYAKAVRKHLASIIPNMPDAPICGPLIGITDNLVSTYLEEIASSESPASALADDTAILYVPDYYVSDTGALTAVDLAFSDQREENLISEQTIATGDVVFIESGDIQTPLTIAGVIRTFSQKLPVDFNPGRPYSLICNETTYRKLVGTQDYAYVLAYGDKTAIPYQTDVELSKLDTGLLFENRRMERTERAEQIALQTLLALILSGFGFWGAILLRLALDSSQEKQTREKYQTLFQLGLQPTTLRKHLLGTAMQDSALGLLTALLALIAFRCFEEKTILKSFVDFSRPSAPQYFFDIIERCFLYTDWWFVATIVIAVFSLQWWMLWASKPVEKAKKVSKDTVKNQLKFCSKE